MCFDSNYVPFVNLLGLFGQIRDDLMNLQSAEVGSLLTTLSYLCL